MVALHELDNPPRGIGPCYRSRSASDEAGGQYPLEAHTGYQPEHSANEHAAGHERDPHEGDQPPKAVAVDSGAVLVGDVLDRGQDVAHERILQQGSGNASAPRHHRLSGQFLRPLLDPSGHGPVR